MSAPLTPAGEAAITELAQRYGVSDGAVRTMLAAVVRGGGAMAQFSHPELGGNGQWMRGGMTMVGDMFNSGLQSTVAGICSDLASRLASGELLVRAPDRASAGATVGSFSGDWWPSDLGRPSTSGGQNDSAYAYFPGARRLAIKYGAAVRLFDTGEHAISGVQQQQGGRGSLEFTSQFGSFTVDSLPIVGADGATPVQPAAAQSQSQERGSSAPASEVPPRPAPQGAAPTPASAPPPTAPVAPPPPAAVPAAAAVPASPPSAAPAAPPPAPHPSPAAGERMSAADIGSAIETLAGLRDKGFLTDAEFTTKKVELLARL